MLDLGCKEEAGQEKNKETKFKKLDIFVQWAINIRV
jgi:hypothetical protein